MASPLCCPQSLELKEKSASTSARFGQKPARITLDPAYGNTGACKSAITFIDGEKGILQYRGYDIAELAQKSTFIETAYLLIYGELPTSAQLTEFSGLLTENEMLHEGMRHHFEGFPPTAHPMAILSSMINAASSYHPEPAPRAGGTLSLPCRAPDFPSPHHRRVLLSQGPRTALDLSENHPQIHGELPAHDVLLSR